MGGIRGCILECVFSAGEFLVVKSLRGDAAGFSVEDSVVFPWDQGLSRVPVGNSGRVPTVAHFQIDFGY